MQDGSVNYTKIVKGKLSLWLIKDRELKMYGEVEVWVNYLFSPRH